VASVALGRTVVIGVYVLPAIRPMAGRARGVGMVHRRLVAVAASAFCSPRVIKPILVPIQRIVTTGALATIVVRPLMTAHTIGQAQVAERNQPPILAIVTVGARTGIVSGRQDIAVTIQTRFKASVAELGIRPVDGTVTIGTRPGIMSHLGCVT